MSLYPVPLPAFQDNYIWTLAVGGSALVVDPGDAAVVEAWLREQELKLAIILVTHHHPDHVGGLAELKRRHSPVVYGPDENIAGVDHVLQGGGSLALPLFGNAKVLGVPGHTLGHIAYYLPQPELLFCGDTLFSAGCGRLFEGTAEQMYHSLQTLAALPGSTRLCCTHEYTLSNLKFAAAVEPDNVARIAREDEARLLRAQGEPTLPVALARELAYNPFLRSHEPEVVRQMEAATGQSLAPGLPTFTAMRAWKDRF